MRKAVTVAAFAAGLVAVGSLVGAGGAIADDTLYSASTDVSVSAGGQPVLDVTSEADMTRDPDFWTNEYTTTYSVAGMPGGTHQGGSSIYCTSGSVTAAAVCAVLDAVAALP